MCEKSGVLIQTAYQRTVLVPLEKRHTIPMYHTRTIAKKAYRNGVPYYLAKIEAYCTYTPHLRTAPTYRTYVPYLHTMLHSTTILAQSSQSRDKRNISPPAERKGSITRRIN